MDTILKMILSIVLLGLAALAGYIFDALGLSVLQVITSRAFGICAAIVFVLWVALKIRRAFSRSMPREEAGRVKIIGARMADGVGELTIEAKRSQDALDALSIRPHGSWIVTIKQNELYRFDFPARSRKQVEQVARDNGYLGEVGSLDT